MLFVLQYLFTFWAYCTISFNLALAVTHHGALQNVEMSQRSWSISLGAKIIWRTCSKYRNFLLPAALNCQKNLGMSQQLWEGAETKILAGPSHVTRPAELNEIVQ